MLFYSFISIRPVILLTHNILTPTKYVSISFRFKSTSFLGNLIYLLQFNGFLIWNWLKVNFICTF